MIICKNCNANIPPQWVYAINSGACPGCGNDFWSENDKELLFELRNAIEKMPNADAASIVGWLLSNYQLKKIGAAEPTDFHRKKTGRINEQDPITAGLKIADNPKSVFLQRAGMARELSRRDNLASIATQINQAAGLEEDLVSVDLDEISDYEGMDEHETVAMVQSQQTQGHLAKRVLANNSLLISGNAPPPTPEEAAAIAHALAGQTHAIEGDLPPVLQADRYKRLIAQEEVAAGGRAGIIQRR